MFNWKTLHRSNPLTKNKVLAQGGKKYLKSLKSSLQKKIEEEEFRKYQLLSCKNPRRDF